MRKAIPVAVAIVLAAIAPPANAQKAAAPDRGPVVSWLLGVCLPWIAGVQPAKMVEALERQGLKACWVGTRLSGFTLPKRPEFVYSGIVLGEGGAWCQISLSYGKTRVNAIAAAIDAVTAGMPAYFRLVPVPAVTDQHDILPDRAWAAPGATLKLTETPSDFPGSTGRGATLYIEKRKK